MKRSLSETKQRSNDALVIDFTRESEVLPVFPSGSLLSSQPGQWNGIYLSYYQHPPYEIPETVSRQHLVIVHLEVPIQAEQRIGTRFQKEYFQAGSVLLIPAHTPHYACWDTEHRYLILSLDPTAFLNTGLSASDGNIAELVPHFATAAPLIHGIGLALKAELESNNLGGRLYADSLSTALFTHLLRHYSAQKLILPAQKGGLPTYRLKQVIEYIDTYLDRDLALADLAAVAQLSPNYFMHLFKQSTGLTPHRYVIQQRVERAKQLLIEGKLAIADIALQVGFAHQSHLNRHFKRWVGVTPRVFLNNQ